MSDVHTKEIRSNPDSYREAAIKGKNTKPEILVRNPLTNIFVSLEKLKRYEYHYKLHLFTKLYNLVI